MSLVGDIRTAVVGRLNGDTGAGGLFETGQDPPLCRGVYWEYAGRKPSMPFLVADAMLTEVHTDTSRNTEVMIDVHIFCAWENSDGWSSVEQAEKIAERIIGDWPQQVGHQPSFGLDRWSMGLAGYFSQPLAYRGLIQSNTVDSLHHIVTFTTFVAENGV